jgi:hypothetical protein
VQQVGDPPGRIVPEHLAHQALVLVHVAVVVAQRTGPEDEVRLRLGVVAGSVDPGHPARLVVHRHPPVLARLRIGAGEGEVVVLVPQELRLRAEGQPADGGVQAVGADDQVEAAGAAAVEHDGDTAVVLLEVADGVAEDVLDVGHLVQQRDQVAAHDLDRAGVPDVDAGGTPVVGVDELHAEDVGGRGPDPRHEPHPLGHVRRRVPHVDPVPPDAHRGAALDHGGLEAVAGQPVGQRQPGDAAARDQDPLGHPGPPVLG